MRFLPQPRVMRCASARAVLQQLLLDLPDGQG